MTDNPNPLTYHYEINIKLNYFILSADIALLGWTIVNTGWLPNDRGHIFLMSIFWLLVTSSVVSGIIRQLYDGMAFGVNHQAHHVGELAATAEQAASSGKGAINQQTGENVSIGELQRVATSHRQTEREKVSLYWKLQKRAQCAGNAAICLLVIALFLLAAIKASVL